MEGGEWILEQGGYLAEEGIGIVKYGLYLVDEVGGVALLREANLAVDCPGPLDFLVGAEIHQEGVGGGG